MNKGLAALERMAEHIRQADYDKGNIEDYDVLQFVNDYQTIEKQLKALEIIKENLVVSYDEGSNDGSCLVIGVKVSKDNLVIIYETFEQDKIDLLKEALQ